MKISADGFSTPLTFIVAGLPKCSHALNVNKIFTFGFHVKNDGSVFLLQLLYSLELLNRGAQVSEKIQWGIFETHAL